MRLFDLMESPEDNRPHNGPKYDPELANAKRFAQLHYPTLDPDSAFDKLLQRSMKHGEEDDDRQDDEIKALSLQVANLEKTVNQLKQEHSKMRKATKKPVAAPAPIKKQPTV